MSDKTDLLKKAGFVYSFDRDLYYNRKIKKAFSVEFVEDHSPGELRGLIDEEGGSDKWRFYFNTAPSKAVERELEGVLG